MDADAKRLRKIFKCKTELVSDLSDRALKSIDPNGLVRMDWAPVVISNEDELAAAMGQFSIRAFVPPFPKNARPTASLNRSPPAPRDSPEENVEGSAVDVADRHRRLLAPLSPRGAGAAGGCGGSGSRARHADHVGVRHAVPLLRMLAQGTGEHGPAMKRNHV